MKMSSSPPAVSPLSWAVFAVPLAYMAVSFLLRNHGGPEWVWRHLDPDYFYLFDGLNIATLTAPGHIAHPGVPLHVLIGFVLRLAHPLSDADALVRAVLADPESHLLLISALLIALNGAIMALVGWAALRATGSLPLAMIVQMGPLLSMLTVKFALRVKPEPLLVAVVLAMAAVMLLALDKDQLHARRLRFAVTLGLIAGFGAALKIVAAPLLGLLPVFLLGTRRAILVFWATCALAAVAFFLPAISELSAFIDWITLIGKGSGAFGAGAQTVVDPAAWLVGFRRMLGRTAVSLPLILSIITFIWAGVRHRRGLSVRGPAVRALAGVTLAVVAQAVVVAKNPSGHYMIPAYALGGFSLALSLYILTDPAWWPRAGRRIAIGLGVLAGALIIAQGFSLLRLDREVTARHERALAVENLLASPALKACAQVSYFPSSSPAFALMMGDSVSRSYRGAALAAHVPKGRYFIRDWMPWDPVQVRGPEGPVSLKSILEAHACTVLRGGHPHRLADMLAAEGLTGLTFDDTCQSPPETLSLIGARCPR